MNRRCEIIREGLQALSNANEPGCDCWVTFEANHNEHWLQCAPTQINMDWPFSSSPSDSVLIQACFGTDGHARIDAWDADTYVTVTPAVVELESLIAGIDRVFSELYDLGPDYSLTYKVEHS